MKKTKYIKTANYSAMGLILLSMGVLAVWKQSSIISFLFIILGLMLLWDGGSTTLSLWNSHNKQKTPMIQIVLKFILAIIFLFYRVIPMSIITILFASYMLLHAIINIINCYLYYKNHASGWGTFLFSFLFYITFSVSLFLSPFLKLDTVMIIIGVYCILLSFTFFKDAMHIGISEDFKQRTKRKIRITLPVALVAILPKLTLERINNYLNDEDSSTLNEFKEDQEPDMEIYIHAGTSGFGAIGHLDLSFEGTAVSYGNYDRSSFHLFEAIGDGVLFTAPLEPYLPFCIHHEENNIFAFGFRLSDEEKTIVRKTIEEIKKNTIPWNPPIAQQDGWKTPDKFDDFASQLLLATNASLYKFKKGKFKTYFVLGTNCVLLVDSVIGKLGTDVLNMRGLISPGTYLDYLQKEYLKKDSRVISSQVYLSKKKEKSL